MACHRANCTTSYGMGGAAENSYGNGSQIAPCWATTQNVEELAAPSGICERLGVQRLHDEARQN